MGPIFFGCRCRSHVKMGPGEFGELVCESWFMRCLRMFCKRREIPLVAPGVLI
jgi:hypothetical protein